jgi:hypothetical protein
MQLQCNWSADSFLVHLWLFINFSVYMESSEKTDDSERWLGGGRGLF